MNMLFIIMTLQTLTTNDLFYFIMRKDPHE